jgi:hypothetical protein
VWLNNLGLAVSKELEPSTQRAALMVWKITSGANYEIRHWKEGDMEAPHRVQSRLHAVEVKAARLERWLRFTAIAWLATLALFLASASFPIPRAGAQATKGTTDRDVVRARRFVVVDENGSERIVIAAPLPDPLVNGQVRKRRTAVSAGVQFKDSDGTERGGIAAMADGSFLFGIDDERGRERAHLYYVPTRGSGIYLQGEDARGTVSLLIPPAGKDAKLEMSNKEGVKILSLPSPR